MTDNTPLNADDELRVTFATIPEELCEHGVNLSLCNCHRCDGTAIYTEADRKKHELQARINGILFAKNHFQDFCNEKEHQKITSHVASLKQDLEKL